MYAYLFGVLCLSSLCYTKENNSISEAEYRSSCRIYEEKVLCKGIISDELSISSHILLEEKFKGLQIKIKQLEIRQGHTPKIPSNAFMGLTSVRHITIQNMSVTTIHSKAFNGIQHFKFIDLSNNDIRQLPSDLFKYNGVKHLKLSNNPNLIIPNDKPLISAPLLHWLSLSGCSIKTLSENSFSEMPTIGHLDLSQNQIDSLPIKIFQNIPLTFLDLSNNNLKVLNIDMFKKILNYPVQPRIVVLKNNPWHCDCDLIPVVNWLSQDLETHYPTSDPRKSRLIEHTKCVSPFQFSGVSWHNFEMPQCYEDKENQLI